MMVDENNPLVSVCVVTYNSEDFVIETLESVKAQSYKNIELIVSDDCSIDNTIQRCEEWIKLYGDSFINAVVISTKENSGVSCNCNNAISYVKGNWIKFIAGDDLLLPNCIQDNVSFVKDNLEADVVFSDYDYFISKNSSTGFRKSRTCKPEESFFSKDKAEQLNILLANNPLPSPTEFVRAKVYKENPYNELFKYMEDTPMWVKLSLAGYEFRYLNKKTVLYRQHDSLSHGDTRFFSPLMVESSKAFFWTIRLPLIKQRKLSDAYLKFRREFFLYDLTEVVLKNKKNRFTNIIYHMLRWCVLHLASFGKL